MPLVADNVRQKIYDEVVSVLGTIGTAGGYNTDPAVVGSYREAKVATASAVLYVVPGREAFGDPGLAGRQQCTLELLITGRIRKPDDGDTIESIHALLQDVRNAIAGNRSAFPGDADAHLIGFDETDTIDGDLTRDGSAWFVQPVTFIYVAGATW